MGVLQIITILIILSALFTFINISVLKLPSTIGLMLLALGLSFTVVILGYFFPVVTNMAANIMKFDFSYVLLNVMLSFLLFAGALHIDLNKLAEEKWSILTLATLGVLISTFITGTIVYVVLPYLGLNISYIHCLLFGALISPTDPIAVLAMVKKNPIAKNLEIKIAGESLFNDGIGVVVFLTILHISRSGAEVFDPFSALALFGQEVLGGIAMGMALGLLGFWLLKIVDNDHVELEVLITLSMVMGGAQLAEIFHVSGPLAMVIMGIIVGNEGRSEALSNVTGEYVYKFWHLIDEALNAILFILIGLEMIIITFRFDFLVAGLFAIQIVLLSRWIGVGLPVLFMSLTRKFEKNTITILTWGGLRGGISVALALSLPKSLESKELIVAITYSVVLFSILVQGLTIRDFFKAGAPKNDNQIEEV